MKLLSVLSTGCILLTLSHCLRGQESSEKDIIEPSLMSCNITSDGEHKTPRVRA